MMAGRIDLTIGFGIVMWHILAMSLLVNYGVPWPLAILLVVGSAALIGLINGLLVEVAQIDSFIATLGTGTILYALALWHTDGRQIIEVLPQGFVQLNTLSIAGIPIPAVYAIVVAVLLWIVTERLPIGRHIYAIGANEGRRAQRHPGPALRDRRVRRVGIMAGFAGCVLAAKLRIGQANVGLDYLLPALVGAFLGSTTIKPGRVNVWGHDVRRADSRRRHLGDPATRRRLLRRAPVQRHDAGHLDRPCRLCPAPPVCGQDRARSDRIDRQDPNARAAAATAARQRNAGGP